MLEPAVYEIAGIQRIGKSTLLNALLEIACKLNNPNRIVINWTLKNNNYNIKSVNTEELIEEILKIKKDKIPRCVIGFDEMSQYITGRGYKQEKQTKIAQFCWQVPHREHILLCTSNIANSIDIIVRQAAWFTLMPQFTERTRIEDKLKFTMIWNYRFRRIRNCYLYDVKRIQETYDDHEPIE